jgi:hypothetical protein
MILAGLIVTIACIMLLNRGGSVALVTGVFVVARLAFVLLLGGGFVAILVNVVVGGVVAFAWFWLLDRLEGSILWWVALILGGLIVSVV